MRITDAFRGEHGVFYAQFGEIEAALPHEPPLTEVATRARLLAAALETHAQLEDELLFVHLEPVLGKEAGPLVVMRREHEEVEGGLARLAQVRDAVEARDLLAHVVRVAREHFAKEEQILYVVAEQALRATELADLGRQWAVRRGVVVP